MARRNLVFVRPVPAGRVRVGSSSLFNTVTSGNPHPLLTPLTDKNICSLLAGKRHSRAGCLTWAAPLPAPDLVLTSIEPGAEPIAPHAVCSKDPGSRLLLGASVMVDPACYSRVAWPSTQACSLIPSRCPGALSLGRQVDNRPRQPPMIPPRIRPPSSPRRNPSSWRGGRLGRGHSRGEGKTKSPSPESREGLG
jgi:hypothetical protein